MLGWPTQWGGQQGPLQASCSSSVLVGVYFAARVCNIIMVHVSDTTLIMHTMKYNIADMSILHISSITTTSVQSPPPTLTSVAPV